MELPSDAEKRGGILKEGTARYGAGWLAAVIRRDGEVSSTTPGPSGRRSYGWLPNCSV
jgi:hypothetical protein